MTSTGGASSPAGNERLSPAPVGGRSARLELVASDIRSAVEGFAGAHSVLHVTQPVTEGVGNYVRFLATHQVDLGHRVGLACLPSSQLATTAEEAGVEVFRFEADREPSRALRSEIRQLAAAVSTFQPDVVHLHSSKAGMAGRLALRGRRATVFQPHAWSFEAASGVIGRAAREWERMATRWTDAIITVSEGERDLGEPYGILTAGDATVLNPVDTDRFRPPRAGEQEALRSRLGLGAEPIVLCVGRICEQKGQDVLLDAWNEVRRQVPDARLLLVGDGPDRDALEARGADGVTFLGARDDVPGLLRVADVVALPSRWEGMSLAMLEAMASGRSVVATDVGGAGETIAKGAGAVIAIGVPEQLADEIIRRLRQPGLAADEGATGRALAEERHSLSSTVAAVGEVYDSALSLRAATGGSRSTTGPG